ncbi:pyridoxamine 5'-phosphate oxidase family protein [Desulfovibrio aminophilus]|uniref:pyridoxamine 5'-phosphate oxidase family protein n=1 Tax=Desulfovibrio aminophilus TaxID=81425 RepID=UPI0003FA85B0|nr:pyridoxamine 5'-phosphate oxidase family protein [Desulfovibrio aminophilus]
MSDIIPDTLRELFLGASHGVLATTGPGGPHASLMGLAPAGAGPGLYLVTGRNSRKFRNLLADPRAALLLDDRAADPRPEPGAVRALTVLGRVRVLEGEEERPAAAAIAARHPHLRGFVDAPDAAFLLFVAEILQLLEGPSAATVLDLR